MSHLTFVTTLTGSKGPQGHNQRKPATAATNNSSSKNNNNRGNNNNKVEPQSKTEQKFVENNQLKLLAVLLSWGPIKNEFAPYQLLKNCAGVCECALCVLGTYQIGLGHYPCVILLLLLLLLLGVCPFFRHLASISQVLPCNKGGHLPHKNPRRDANRTNYTRTHRTPNRTVPNRTELNWTVVRRGEGCETLGRSQETATWWHTLAHTHTYSTKCCTSLGDDYADASELCLCFSFGRIMPHILLKIVWHE